MKKVFLLALISILLISTIAHAAPYRRRSSDVYVQSYTRRDGTYVRSHYRSAPDSSTSNNYGSWDYDGGGGDNF